VRDLGYTRDVFPLERADRTEAGDGVAWNGYFGVGKRRIGTRTVLSGDLRRGTHFNNGGEVDLGTRDEGTSGPVRGRRRKTVL